MTDYEVIFSQTWTDRLEQRKKDYRDREDIPLNDFGRHLAKETGVGLRNVRFDLCFSSDLKRALETANLILDEGSNKVPIIMDKRLKEIAFGEWEGKKCSKKPDGSSGRIPEILR